MLFLWPSRSLCEGSIVSSEREKMQYLFEIRIFCLSLQKWTTSEMANNDVHCVTMEHESVGKLEANAEKGEEMRRQSLESFKETQKRKNESYLEPDRTPKRRRASGSDTKMYLKEKCKVEQKFKEEELDLRKQEMVQKHGLHLY